MYSTGPLYHEVSPGYTDHCPPMQDGNMNYYNQNFRNTAYDSDLQSSYQQQSNQSIFNRQQQSYSMSENILGLNNMTRQSQQEAVGQQQTTPNDLTTVTNAPDMQWMVTTSNIDIRTLTPPSTVGASNTLGSSYNTTYQGYQSTRTTPRVQNKSNLTKANKPKGTPGRKRKIEDHQLPPEEAAKRRLRRERNKLAAAKCRNRRRELTDRLQGETDQLEDIKSILHQDIMALQREKEHLEFILAAHNPECKSGVDSNIFNVPEQMMSHSSFNESMESDFGQEVDIMHMASDVNNQRIHQQRSFDQSPPLAAPVSVITAGPSASNQDMNVYGQMSNPIMQQTTTQIQQMLNGADITDFAALSGLDNMEPLNTPVCTLATPSNTNAVFTFPSTPCTSGGLMTDVYSSAVDYTSSNGGNGPIMSTGQNNQMPYNSTACYYDNTYRNPQSCSEAHRQSSSSEGYQSPDAVRSPHKLLSL